MEWDGYESNTSRMAKVAMRAGAMDWKCAVGWTLRWGGAMDYNRAHGRHEA